MFISRLPFFSPAFVLIIIIACAYDNISIIIGFLETLGTVHLRISKDNGDTAGGFRILPFLSHSFSLALKLLLLIIYSSIFLTANGIFTFPEKNLVMGYDDINILAKEIALQYSGVQASKETK